MADRVLEGGCQCGAVRYRVTGDPMFAAYCHCSKCRRAHAAPAVAWMMYPEGQVGFLKGQLATFASSEEGRRHFCPACGTQISFTASFLPGLIDIAVGSLDDPAAMPPMLHIWDSARMPWAKFDDGLPRHAELPPFG